MRFSEKYRPQTLDEVVGQPFVRMFKALAANPYSCCILLECQHGGVGKTSTALAFANDVGCPDEMHGLHIVPCSEFSIEVAREMFDGNRLRLRPMMGKGGWHCVILEEFDWLPAQTQRYLKVALETRLPSRCIVVATSNGTGKLDRALLQRFHHYAFSYGAPFRDACIQRLRHIWKLETGSEEMPEYLIGLGDTAEQSFSLRVALDKMQDMIACEQYRQQELAVA